jgi:Mrp family chromosome partitioning ATPase
VRLKQLFDYVIIDSSPVFAKDCVTTLTPCLDGTLFTVCSAFSRSGPMTKALELLSRCQVQILGVEINGTNAASKSCYYNKKAEYYHSRSGKVKKIPPKGRKAE